MDESGSHQYTYMYTQTNPPTNHLPQHHNLTQQGHAPRLRLGAAPLPRHAGGARHGPAAAGTQGVYMYVCVYVWCVCWWKTPPPSRHTHTHVVNTHPPPQTAPAGQPPPAALPARALQPYEPLDGAHRHPRRGLRHWLLRRCVLVVLSGHVCVYVYKGTGRACPSFLRVYTHPRTHKHTHLINQPINPTQHQGCSPP